MNPDQVLQFWFSESARKRWFRSTPAFDTEIRERFESAWQAARDGRLTDWEQTASGALALVIVLDQFPLNMYRNQALGFSTEPTSRDVAECAIERDFDNRLTVEQKAFLYLPFMHSEDLRDQDRSVALFAAAGLEDNLIWAHHHREIIVRFGRFPHRNAILDRISTADELAWLDSPQSFKP
jgi:uncharacterized protein (DUF924 family)